MFDLPRQVSPSLFLPKAVSPRLQFRLKAVVNENAEFVLPSRKISNSRRK